MTNDALIDVIHARAQVLREETADLGTGGWLAKLYPALKGGTRELMRGRPGHEKARELFVEVSALAALVVEAIDQERGAGRRRSNAA